MIKKLEKQEKSKSIRKQEVRNVHGLDALIVPARKIIRPQNILGVIVPDVQKPVIFPPFGLFGGDSFRDLDIELFILPCGNKVNLAVVRLSDIHNIPPAA